MAIDPTRVPRFGHGSRVPGWDEAADLTKDPEQVPDPATTPENYLLWFHHVPWDYKTGSGRSMWDELNYRYMQGVAAVETMQKTWASLKGQIDDQRFAAVSQ